MKKASHIIFFVALFFFLLPNIYAQSNQSWTNGQTTAPINFAGSCTYTWTNDNASIGLSPGGTGPIPAFKAVNNGSLPAIAHITATPILPSSFAYIANSGSNSISVINTTTNTLSGITIPIGLHPYGVVVSPDGNFIYVTNSNSPSVSVINTVTNAVISTINNVQSDPGGLCLSPNGKTLYVANDGTSTISVINTTTYQVVNTFSTTAIPGANPYALAVSPDGSKLYICYHGLGIVSVVNTSNDALIANISVGDGPFGIVISPDGKYVYVANQLSTYISVIDASINKVVSTINVSSQFAPTALSGLAISSNGNTLYVADELTNLISVISIAAGMVTNTINLGPGNTPIGISLTADGSELYVSNEGSNSVSVINTLLNKIINTINVGSEPFTFGNFIKTGTGCSPTTFTITVNPTPGPTITAGPVIGTITACKGTASADPDLEQFTLTGNNLTGPVTVNCGAPDFEIALTPDGFYSNTVTLGPVNGYLGTSTVYVKASAYAHVGNPSVNLLVSTPGLPDKPVIVSATIYDIPMADVPAPQTVINGSLTNPIIFKGTADTYTWVNNTPGIGLSPNGSGNIPAFTAVNNTGDPIIATITVTPINGSGCAGTPVEFNLTVEPTPPVLTVTGTLTPLTTVYGTASQTEIFSVASNTINTKILITPPAGFEVSGDGKTFALAVTLTTTVSNAQIPVYIRLAATTHVGQGYGGEVAISNPNAKKASITMPESSVTRALLTISADNKTKAVGAANPIFTASYSGFVNNDGPAQLTSLPELSTIANVASAVGQYAIDIAGASSPDYIINYNMGVLNVVPSLNISAIPNTFTPNGDGKNDTWVITDLQYYPKATVNIYNRYGQKLYTSIGYPVPWDGKYKGKILSSGTYYYIIDPKDGEPVIAGWVAIIK